MAVPYNHLEIESKWSRRWEEHPININDGKKPKYYCLDMFPYPSGAGLHVGHWRGYVISDVWARYKMMDGGHYVIHPMGWDAFGLPAENYAIKTGQHPSISTENNIRNIRRQIKQIGAVRDWDMELNTTDPKFYKWTQWIFVQMFRHGLAYEKKMPLNWCPHCKAVLANEEVVDGKCERCGSEVTKKNLRQWMLKITAYADRLLDGLETLDWPEKVKKMQTDWIGRSYGAEVDFPVDGSDEKITVYTTRPDTLWGATFMVLSPEHPLAKKLASPEQADAVEAYCQYASGRSNVERVQNKEKTGVFTGAYAVNPLNHRKVPIWLSDYVLADYGTGAIMCVPAHDDRDFEFAKKFGLPIIQVIAKDGKEIPDMQEAYTEASGTMINSGDWNGMESSVLKQEAPMIIEKMGIGRKTVNYKLRDWVFSRQRYWGEPIPIIHMEDGTLRAVSEDNLPLELPATDNYQPSADGESPLANCTDWLNVTIDGMKGKRETNTMPQWAGSCWYYIRYLDPHNDKEIADRKLMDHWLPVDLYIGGAEHAVLHLLYSRFWYKVLHDCGVVSNNEPFQKLFHQGMILGSNGVKMSKSLGNVVNPDELVASHGADALRVYEMFMGPLEASLPWSDKGMDGARKWLERVDRMITSEGMITDEPTGELDYVYNFTVKKVTSDIETLNFNTAISQMMIFVNEVYRNGRLNRTMAENFVKMLSCFAPHLGEELYADLTGKEGTIAYEPWPAYEESKLVLQKAVIVVQINGKVRAKFETVQDASQEELISQAEKLPEVQKYLEGKTIRKVIAIPNKIVNIVVG